MRSRRSPASPLFDIQQHTYSHVVFRDVRYRPEGGETEAVLPETPAGRAARGAPAHLGADPQVPRPRVHRPAHPVRLLPRAARPARPARDRPRDGPPLRHLVGPQRGEREPDAVGAAVRLRRGGVRRPARDPVPVLARRDLVRRERLRRGARVPPGARGRRRRDRGAGPRVRDRVPRVVRGRGGRGGHRLDPRPDRARARARRRGHELRRLLGTDAPRGASNKSAGQSSEHPQDRAP